MAKEPREQSSNREKPAPQIILDDSKTNTAYANFCRVTGNPEELIIDFALNPQAIGIPETPIPVFQRTVMSFNTAKRLLHALELTIEKHESKYGFIEMYPKLRQQNKKNQSEDEE